MKITLYAKTLSYLKFKQILWRIIYYFYHPSITDVALLPLRTAQIAWKVGSFREKAKISPTHFCFLNSIQTVEKIDDWNNPHYAKLWLYHLHYFDDLSHPECQKEGDYYQNLINQWIVENPPVMGVGWEPYPISRRIPNWIKWHLSGHALSKDVLISLIQQAIFLRKKIEYHLFGNHLLANAKALVFVGLFFESSLATSWYQKGMAIYHQELKTQILADGGHVEQTPLYHALILEDILDVIQLHQIYDKPYPEHWNNLIKQMFLWLAALTHPDGGFAFFNDTANKAAPTLSELCSYANLLGVAVPNLKLPPIQYFANTGYARIEEKNFSLIADIGQFADQSLTGHAHADTLSFELSVNTRRVFVNSGISTYAIGAARTEQRSTAAHNTVTIDHKNSSHIWHAFRCAERAFISDVSVENRKDHRYISARHNGYNKYPTHAFHQRQWFIYPSYIKVIDHISGQGIHEVNLHLHCHPDYYVIQPEKHKIELFHLTGNPQVKCFFPSNTHVTIHDSHWYPEFGFTLDNKKIIATLHDQLPLEIEWYIMMEASTLIEV